MAFAEKPQNALSFPLSLVERMRPRRIADFIGIARPRAALLELVRSPRPCKSCWA